MHVFVTNREGWAWRVLQRQMLARQALGWICDGDNTLLQVAMCVSARLGDGMNQSPRSLTSTVTPVPRQASATNVY